jgi:hypothetical protein
MEPSAAGPPVPSFNRSETKVMFVDLLSLRPIRFKDGRKPLLMPDGNLVGITMPRVICTAFPNPRTALHPTYLWQMALVLALKWEGYRVLSVRNHVLETTRLPSDLTPLSDKRLLVAAINARVAAGPVRGPTLRKGQRSAFQSSTSSGPSPSHS